MLFLHGSREGGAAFDTHEHHGRRSRRKGRNDPARRDRKKSGRTQDEYAGGKSGRPVTTAAQSRCSVKAVFRKLGAC